MPGTFDILIREMIPADYHAVFKLWEGIKGFGGGNYPVFKEKSKYQCGGSAEWADYR